MKASWVGEGQRYPDGSDNIKNTAFKTCKSSARSKRITDRFIEATHLYKLHGDNQPDFPELEYNIMNALMETVLDYLNVQFIYDEGEFKFVQEINTDLLINDISGYFAVRKV